MKRYVLVESTGNAVWGNNESGITLFIRPMSLKEANDMRDQMLYPDHCYLLEIKPMRMKKRAWRKK